MVKLLYQLLKQCVWPANGPKKGIHYEFPSSPSPFSPSPPPLSLGAAGEPMTRRPALWEVLTQDAEEIHNLLSLKMELESLLQEVIQALHTEKPQHISFRHGPVLICPLTPTSYKDTTAQPGWTRKHILIVSSLQQLWSLYHASKLVSKLGKLYLEHSTLNTQTQFSIRFTQLPHHGSIQICTSKVHNVQGYHIMHTPGYFFHVNVAIS